MNSHYGVADSAPVLISGVYRSGTTFLAALLGAHPKLCATSSTVKYLRFCAGRYGDLNEPANLGALLRETKKRVDVRWEIDLDLDSIRDGLSTFSALSDALVYDLIMRAMLLKGKDADVRWVEKLAMQWSDIPTFIEMFPQGQVIHIVRDPRDVTASYKHMTFEKGYTYLDAAFNCRGAMESLREFERKYSADRLMLVRAEDIANNPEKWAKKVCDFLGLAFDERMLEHKQLHTEGEDWASNTSYGGEYKSFPKAESRWPKRLTPEETAFVEMITQPYMSDFEYPTSGIELTAKAWRSMADFIEDDFLAERFNKWIRSGKGSQGYRTDPYFYEMKIVFPERF